MVLPEPEIGKKVQWINQQPHLLKNNDMKLVNTDWQNIYVCDLILDYFTKLLYSKWYEAQKKSIPTQSSKFIWRV